MIISGVIMLSVALVFGLIATFLANVWLDQQAGQPYIVIQQPSEDIGQVVVAEKALRFGLVAIVAVALAGCKAKSHDDDITYGIDVIPPVSGSKAS